MNRSSNLEIEPLTKKMSNLIGVDASEGSGESCSDSKKMGHQMTIFYEGNVNPYDVTELQARAILMLASHQMEQRMLKEDETPPLTVSFRKQLYDPVNGVSMKGSLRRFLQKRKLRAQARAPYAL